MSTAAPATATPASDTWYGPASQFWPHWIVWAIIRALISSVANTSVAGLHYCKVHPIKTMRGLRYCLIHPRTTVTAVGQRMKASLRRNGVFYTGTCLLCMFLLPGAGLFGKVAELSKAGRKAERLNGLDLPADGNALSAPGDTSAKKRARE